MNGRFYARRVINCEYSPVTDFREAKCRQYNEGHCDRGGYCNFMHPKHVSRDIKKELFKWLYEEYPKYKEDKALGAQVDFIKRVRYKEHYDARKALEAFLAK